VSSDDGRCGHRLKVIEVACRLRGQQGTTAALITATPPESLARRSWWEKARVLTSVAVFQRSPAREQSRQITAPTDTPSPDAPIRDAPILELVLLVLRARQLDGGLELPPGLRRARSQTRRTRLAVERAATREVRPRPPHPGNRREAPGTQCQAHKKCCTDVATKPRFATAFAMIPFASRRKVVPRGAS